MPTTKRLLILAALIALGGVARAQTTEAVTINKTTGAVVNANPSAKFGGANQVPILNGSGQLPSGNLPPLNYIPLNGDTNITGDLGANGGTNWLISESTGAVSFDGGDFTTDGDGDLSMTGALTVGSEIRFDSYAGNSDGSGGINNTIGGPSTYAINGADGTAFFQGFQINNGYFTFDNNAGSSDGNGGFTNDAGNWAISGANGAVSFDAGSVNTNGYGSLYVAGPITPVGGIQDIFGNLIIDSGVEGGAQFHYGAGNGLLTDNVGQLYWSQYNYSNTPLADNNGGLHYSDGATMATYTEVIYADGGSVVLGDGSGEGSVSFADGEWSCDYSGNVSSTSLIAGNFVTTYGALTAGNGSALGSRIWSGSGVPDVSLGSTGDFYFRTDGGTATHIYFKSGTSTWTPVI